MNITKLLLDAYFGDNDSILVLGDFCEENNIYFQELISTDIEGLFLNNNNKYYHSGDGDGYGSGYSNGDGKGGDNQNQAHSNDKRGGYGLGLGEFYL